MLSSSLKIDLESFYDYQLICIFSDESDHIAFRNAASVVSVQGARPYQEDKYVAKLSFRDDPQCAFFGIFHFLANPPSKLFLNSKFTVFLELHFNLHSSGVFDGHGGSRASEHLAKHLHGTIQCIQQCYFFFINSLSSMRPIYHHFSQSLI
jgi:hypothetical protein